jgi:hypothetical protein
MEKQSTYVVVFVFFVKKIVENTPMYQDLCVCVCVCVFVCVRMCSSENELKKNTQPE